MQSNASKMDVDFNGEKLKSLHISSLGEEEDEEEAQNDEVEDEVSDEEDDEEDRIPMTLGFSEKPKNPWSLLRQYFPSKAGGSPVIRRTFNGKLWDWICSACSVLIISFRAIFSTEFFENSTYLVICICFLVLFMPLKRTCN